MPLLTTEERLGKTIAGKYRLDRVLGEGGMGVVYAGYHTRLDLPVAVKFLHAQYSRSQEVVDRFLREARATSRLVHPNVVGVRDVDVADEDGSVYMVLEFLSGESLAHMLEREKALSVDQTLQIILPVADALATAHELGIVHRDIKPDNVFLTKATDGRIIPKVLDFGIARMAGGGSNPSATATGAVMGTALYMAPEQAMGRTKEIGPCSDVWSTAVMTYEMLTGGFPFDVELHAEMNAMQAMMATMTAPIVPLVVKRPELAGVSDVLSRALDRSVATRTASIRSFGEQLRGAGMGVSPEAKISRIVSRPPPPTRVTTGPMEGQSPPVAVVAPALADDAKQRLRDSFAKTELPASMSAPGASSIPSAALQTGQMTPPVRSLTPYLVGAGAVILLGLTIGGVVTFFGNGPTPVPPPPAAPVATTPAPPPLVVPTEPAEIAPPVAAEVVPPVAAEVVPSETHHGGHATHERPDPAAEARIAAERAAAEAASTAASTAAAERAAAERAAERAAAERAAAERAAAERAAAERAAAERAAAAAHTGGDHRSGEMSAGEF